MLLGLMADESSSTIGAVVSPRCPIILNGTNPSQNLIVLNVNTQAPLKFIFTNHPTWLLQFMYLVFGYDLLSFIDDSKLCPLAMITLPDAASPSPNLDHILYLKQDQLLLNVIVRFVCATLVQFISISVTFHAAWIILKKTYVSPLRAN